MRERVTPHSIEAERAVLGAILIDGDRFLDVADRLSSADFFRHPHGVIFTAMRELAVSGQPVDALVLSERLKVRGELDGIGGPAYLFGLTDGVPRGVNLDAYAHIVREKADTRNLIRECEKVLAEALAEEHEARELIDRAERAIFGVSDRSVRGDFIDSGQLVSDGMRAVEKLLETKRGITGVATGFAELDSMTRGLQPGTLVILAARPSMGKSALALNVAYHAATHGHAVGFFSLEMSRQELAMRLLASVGHLDGHRIQSGYVNQTDYAKISGAFSEIAQSGLFIDDSGTVGVLDVRGKARRLKAKHGLGLVIVDYLQLMQLAKSENRNLAVADASRALKLLARELNVPVMALSQLSRETEKRGEKKPMLSDLRDSGALEQDADLVLFIHRSEVYQQTNENAGLADIIIAKNRTGPVGTVTLQWDKTTTRFNDLAPTYAARA